MATSEGLSAAERAAVKQRAKELRAQEKAGKNRAATIGFEGTAHLDDGDLWPTAFAVLAWTPDVEARLTTLVRTAVG